MSIQHVNAVSNRLSLRTPQKESLLILDRLCEIVDFQKDMDVEQALKTIQSEYPSIENFEKDFPSLCFALATGVGKTRLMGAFITYLFRAENITNFFVLAPNLTIYNKLIADFTPNTPKYVFQGIGEFAMEPPEIITGDNYESGRGTRRRLFDNDLIHINIFNISKINTEVRGGKSPRIKRLSEYIGESYFDYLSKLNDLVMIMDESHRYRAKAGMKAINELNPILGLELTATPQIMRGQNAIPFNNVIYSYPLSSALEDGYVKAPSVATRENFNASNYDAAALERLKLEDGIQIHEETKVELEVFSREYDVKRMKPFMLVVAKDIGHAKDIRAIIEADDFYAGQYKGKVIEVHSKQRGEEKDENVQKLLAVEDPENETEIVIHVDQLKEGWDVTNLYTIVPLRAFNSRTLIEQAIGRGLRLPYGKRVGVPAVDRLTIVAHDKFQEIIDEANRGDSVLKIGLVIIGKDIPDTPSKDVEVPTSLEDKLIGSKQEEGQPQSKQKVLFNTEPERIAVQETLKTIGQFERLKSSDELTTDKIQREIVERVKKAIKDTEQLPGTEEEVDVEQIVAEVTKQFVEMSIDIPKIVIAPSDDATYGFKNFDLNCSSIHLQPVSQEILIQNLQTNEQHRLQEANNSSSERRLEDYLIRELIDFDDISYDDHAELLYKLSGQMIEHLHSYLENEGDVLNVLQAHIRALVKSIYSQLQENYFETATSYEVKAVKGFHTLHSQYFLSPADEKVRPFREFVEEKRYIRSMLFGGFEKCLYPQQKFDSDTERRFSIILENDKEALKWFKPSRNVFQIHYRSGIEEGDYEPDFVVETKGIKYLCEPKMKDSMDDSIVIAKAEAAVTWCQHASETGDKPWKYLLIPHDAIDDSKTLAGLAATYEYHGT